LSHVDSTRPPAVWSDPTNDPGIERRIRQIALPVALALAFAASRSSLRAITRVFLTMWVHEAGHAVTAWLCGFGALPGPWRTSVSTGRMPLVSALVAALLGYAVFRAWKVRALGICGGVGLLLLFQVMMTWGTRVHDARALIVFGGDAGSLILGTLMMATIYVAPGSTLHRGWLRWGFLAIGAFAFMDTFADWWDAGHDSQGVVFGENVGVGDSDPTRLVFEYGWSEAKLVSRYMTLSWSCLLFLAALYFINLRRPLERPAPPARPWR
jgi:hypothetical protein